MNGFFRSPMCESRKYCVQCRTDEQFRKGIVASFDDVTDPNFECPFNITKKNLGTHLDSGEIKYPPLSKQVSNVSKAMLRTIVSSISGEKVTVSDDEKQRRLNLCSQCEFYDGKNERCKKCGCVTKYKTKLASEHCPIGVW